jgi:glycosyltransferase involved in cell wall biosynthesis
MKSARIAWLITITPPYWHPLLGEFTRLLPHTTLFTASWFGFTQGCEDSFTVEVVGERKIITLKQKTLGYDVSFMYLSPTIVFRLLRFRPNVVFVDGFCLWTALTVLLKIVMRWRVVLAYAGSSPTVDSRSSQSRLIYRRILIRFIDAFITNNKAGKDYLVRAVGANPHRVFARPYLIPDVKALLKKPPMANEVPVDKQKHPIFLFIGQIIPRKGVRQLLEACITLINRDDHHFTLLIVGEGWQRQELETLTKSYGLESCVIWVGKVPYNCLGHYYEASDVLVFPTLEDVWGMVVPEALAFAKPVICSQFAGSAELVKEGENGYYCNPNDPQQLADLMSRFISNPELSQTMSCQARQVMSQHTPKAVAQFLEQITSFVLGKESDIQSLHHL